ncbi:hypothetical protein [Amycolatopsis anabasis]|uniref:hypothetical protein n=1 Tax=Amycolatopsis anabasis TaxID=1840409 RepID=UPI00131CD7D8|nr:hypothetical protein [Amycolatopsis anabasis]
MSDLELERSLLELADTCRVDELGEFTSLLAQRYARLLSVTGAAVLLTDAAGRIEVQAAFPEQLAVLPHQAVAHGAGPAVECCRTAIPVTVPDVRLVTR